MKTSESSRERISLFADGELDEAQIATLLLELREQQAQADWALYHRIGDVLRSDDMDLHMSEDFAARVSARLESEPIHIAPATSGGERRRSKLLRNMAGAAAIAALAFVVTPSLMDGFVGASDPGVLAEAPSAPVQPVEQVIATGTGEGVILRDPRIDEYLFAHQRVSPSVSGTAQYAREAAYSGK